MTMMETLRALSTLDAVAVCYLLVAYVGIGWWIEHPATARPSVSHLMSEYRRDWMRAVTERENRIFDAQILATLRQGTAFFASTCILAIGGVLALFGNTAPLESVSEGLGREVVPPIVWQMKLMVVVLFLVNGFLKFAWANRMFGYCSVLVASLPNAPGDPGSMPRAMQAAEINIRAARNFNRGLRSLYFALGALAWLAGAIPLLLATTATVALLWEREFLSGARKALLASSEGGSS